METSPWFVGHWFELFQTTGIVVGFLLTAYTLRKDEHPCKIDNILGVGAPVLYIGPAPSHLSEILGELASQVCATVAHGDVDRCVAEIVRLAGVNERGESVRYATAARKFGQPTLLPRLVAELERS